MISDFFSACKTAHAAVSNMVYTPLATTRIGRFILQYRYILIGSTVGTLSLKSCASRFKKIKCKESERQQELKQAKENLIKEHSKNEKKLEVINKKLEQDSSLEGLENQELSLLKDGRRLLDDLIASDKEIANLKNLVCGKTEEIKEVEENKTKSIETCDSVKNECESLENECESLEKMQESLDRRKADFLRTAQKSVNRAIDFINRVKKPLEKMKKSELYEKVKVKFPHSASTTVEWRNEAVAFFARCKKFNTELFNKKQQEKVRFNKAIEEGLQAIKDFQEINSKFSELKEKKENFQEMIESRKKIIKDRYQKSNEIKKELNSLYKRRSELFKELDVQKKEKESKIEALQAAIASELKNIKTKMKENKEDNTRSESSTWRLLGQFQVVAPFMIGMTAVFAGLYLQHPAQFSRLAQHSWSYFGKR